MESSTYCIFEKMPDGNYFCIDEIGNFEEAQIELLLLEAEHPGDYMMLNTVSGKLVRSRPWTPYIC